MVLPVFELHVVNLAVERLAEGVRSKEVASQTAWLSLAVPLRLKQETF
jgi:hypothetical protein